MVHLPATQLGLKDAHVLHRRRHELGAEEALELFVLPDLGAKSKSFSLPILPI
jgi:hypothetical protein